MLEFFDDFVREGAAAGDLGEVFGHLAEDVGRAVGEEEDGFFHRLVYVTVSAFLAFKAPKRKVLGLYCYRLHPCESPAMSRAFG